MVIVIGAGIVGAAIAFELASRGAEVRLLDTRGVGAGATRASAGVLCPHIEGHAAPLLELGVRSLAIYDGLVERVRRSSDRAFEYGRNGTLEVALDRAEAAALRAVSERHRSRGVAHELLDGWQARELEPGLPAGVTAALLVPEHGYVAAGDFTRALVDGAVQLGARVDENTAALGLTHDGSRVRVGLRESAVHADAVVLAAGSWSSLIEVPSSPPVRVKPIRGQLVHLGCSRPPASRVLWGTDCYLVPWRDGSLLVGATMEDVGFDERATAAGVQGLLAAAAALLPSSSSASFLSVRTGLRPATPDELPIIGRSSTVPGVVFATGHYRNGVLLAPLTATIVADLVLDGREAPELATTRPQRFGL